MRGAPHAHCLLWLTEDGETTKKKVVINGERREIDEPKQAPCLKIQILGNLEKKESKGKNI